jgi:hypothetical protein
MSIGIDKETAGDELLPRGYLRNKECQTKPRRDQQPSRECPFLPSAQGATCQLKCQTARDNQTRAQYEYRRKIQRKSMRTIDDVRARQR